MALPGSGSQVTINQIRNEVNSLGGPATVINRIQRGVVSIPGPYSNQNRNVPITSVNMSKTMVNYNGEYGVYTPSAGVLPGHVELTSSTNVKVRSYASYYSPNAVYWEVIEFV